MNTSLTGSSIDNPNNHHSNFSPQGTLQNNSSTMNNGGKDTSNSDVQKLQEQLNDIKEQVCFVILNVFIPFAIKLFITWKKPKLKFWFFRRCVLYAWIDSKIWSFFVATVLVRCVETGCQNVPSVEKQWKEEFYFTEKNVDTITVISFHYMLLKRNDTNVVRVTHQNRKHIRHFNHLDTYIWNQFMFEN